MNYCRNESNTEFELKVLSRLLEPLRKFDLRTLETKPTMAKARKRIIFGAVETRRHLELGNVKGIIVANNLSDESLLGKFKYFGTTWFYLFV